MEAVDSLEKLLKFMKEEWSLNKDRALETCKDCIDKYDGFVSVNGTFINTNILPSILEQKLKLIEEYARLSNLTYPKIDFRIERPRMQSAMSMFMDNYDSAFATPSAPQL